MTYDELEEMIEHEIDNIRPEIKKRFVYRFTDEKSGEYANVVYMNPPLITFFLSNILTMNDKPMKQSIRELLTHEIIHVIQPIQQEYKESEAVEKFQKVNFFL